MKVSFIVPVYKVEQYLDECVQSILAQTYRDIEILLVDDGSPDNCPKLCDEWAGKDSRIIPLHKQNGGLSDARNYGLMHATGAYIVFIDGDDFWRHNDDLEKLVALAKENPQADFIGYNCEYYYPETNRYVPWVEYSNKLATTIDKDSSTIALIKSGTFPMSACLKIIKREMLIEGQILFKKGQIHEDIPWFINLLEHTNQCMFVNQYIYAYRQNVIGSITNRVSDKSFNCLLDIIKDELRKLENYSFSDETKKYIKSFLAYELSILMMEVSKLPKVSQKSARRNLKNLVWLFSYTQNPKVKKVSRMYNTVGFYITEKFLCLYNWYRIRKK